MKPRAQGPAEAGRDGAREGLAPDGGRRPRLLSLRLDLGSDGGGQGRAAIDRALALADWAEVMVLVPAAGRARGGGARGAGGRRETRLRASGREIALLRARPEPAAGRGSMAARVALWRALRRLTRQGRVDLVDLVGWGPETAAALRMARRLGLPVAVTVPEEGGGAGGGAGSAEAPRGWARTRWVRALRGADLVLCADQSAADALRAAGAARAAVVPEGVARRCRPLARGRCREELGLVAGRPLVLCPDPLEPGAGQDHLLRALAALPGPGWRRPMVVLVGDGPSRRRLAELAAELDLADQICLEGEVHPDRLPLYYGAAELVVSLAAGGADATTLREAHACGRRVLGTESERARTLVDRPERGRLVPGEGGAEALGEALREMLAEPAPEPREPLRPGLSWDQVAAELRELMRPLLPPARRPGPPAAAARDPERDGEHHAERDAAGLARGARVAGGWLPLSGRRVVHHHRTQGSGVEGVHIRGVIDALRRLGAEVEALGPPGVAAAPEVAGEPTTPPAPPSRFGRTQQRFASAAPPWVFALAELAYNLPAAPRLRRRLRAGTALLYERYALFGFAGTLAAAGRAPVLLEVNDATVIERSRRGTWLPLARTLERALLARAARVVAVTDTIRLRLVALGIDPARIVTVSNASDPPTATEQERATIRRRFAGTAPVLAGVSGAFLPWHGLDLLVEALAGPLRRGELALLFIGDGPARPAVESLARELGVADAVAFTGRLAAARVSAHLAALDIAVQPDVALHASPMKLFEYLAHGLAIVAPDCASIRSVLVPNEDALLFRRGDRAALLAALRALLDDPRARQRLGANARARWRQSHTWDHNLRRALGPLPGSPGGHRALHRGSCAVPLAGP